MNILLGFIGTIIGAAAILGAGIFAESYKRHRDRQGTASALAGEIHAILNISERRKYVEAFESFAKLLEQGQQVIIPRFLARPLELDPVVDRYLGNLGALGGELPKKITTFHSFLLGIRHDLVRLADGAFDFDLAMKARVIREDLALWKDTVTLGSELVGSLDKIATELWWLESWCQKACAWRRGRRSV